MRKIKPVLEKIYSDLELRETCIPLFIGNSGLGKTRIIKEFAESKGAKLVEIIASQLMPHEVSGIALPEKTKKKMTYFDYDRLADLKDGDIIFFDELLNANPMVLNACLTLLENRTMISGRKLPKVMIVAAANWQGATILTPQIKERFIWYEVAYDPTMWKNYMKKYGITKNIFTELNKLITREGFESGSHNYITPRSVEKAIKMSIVGAETPYNKILDPIIGELIENTTGETIKIKDYEFLPNEKVSWIKLKQLENGVIEK